MCRYALRPAAGQGRLHIAPDGQVVLDLRLERLAALVPRPRINLVLYYGVLAPRAAWREAVVPSRIRPIKYGLNTDYRRGMWRQLTT
jgi:hypothetical protein